MKFPDQIRIYILCNLEWPIKRLVQWSIIIIIPLDKMKLITWISSCWPKKKKKKKIIVVEEVESDGEKIAETKRQSHTYKHSLTCIYIHNEKANRFHLQNDPELKFKFSFRADSFFPNSDFLLLLSSVCVCVFLSRCVCLSVFFFVHFDCGH